MANYEIETITGAKQKDRNVRTKLRKFIVKFGYNARCHWLKERAL